MESGSAESGLDEAGEGNSVEPVKEKVLMTNQCRFLRGIRLGVGICLRISKASSETPGGGGGDAPAHASVNSIRLSLRVWKQI